MKLLLRRDIPKLGLCGDIVEVSAGHARNYLLPHHLAFPPSKANLRLVEEDKKVAAAERERIRNTMVETCKRLSGAEVHINAACTPEGHLYGSVGPREIAHALMEEGHSVHPDQIKMSHNIKEVGTVEVPVVFADDIRTTLKVWIVAERAAGSLENQPQEVKDDAGSTTADSNPAPDAGSTEH